MDDLVVKTLQSAIRKLGLAGILYFYKSSHVGANGVGFLKKHLGFIIFKGIPTILPHISKGRLTFLFNFQRN